MENGSEIAVRKVIDMVPARDGTYVEYTPRVKRTPTLAEGMLIGCVGGFIALITTIIFNSVTGIIIGFILGGIVVLKIAEGYAV